MNNNTIFMRLVLSFIAALVLSIIPIPYSLDIFRPPWVLLLVLYIEYYIPGNFKLLTLLFIGVLLDVLFSTIIGEHSFALLVVTWLASTKSRRFQLFTITQQLLLIGFFCFFYQLIITLINALLGFHYTLMLPLASAVVSMFFWPWFRLFAEDALKR